MNTTTLPDLPAAWRADPKANAEGCARQLEEMLASMPPPKSELPVSAHWRLDYLIKGRKAAEDCIKEMFFAITGEEINEEAMQWSRAGEYKETLEAVRQQTLGWQESGSSMAGKVTEQSEKIVSLTAQLDFCRNTLLNAGWTHQAGAKAWKPPVNVEAGETWRKLIKTEEELAAAMKAVKDLADKLTRRDQDVAKLTGRLRYADAMLAARDLQGKPASNTCPCSFPHPPHDYCDGSPAQTHEPRESDRLVRPEFVARMEAELRANAHKGDWQQWRPTVLTVLAEIQYHEAKLMQALAIGDCEHVREFAADVANLAMKVDEQFGGPTGATEGGAA